MYPHSTVPPRVAKVLDGLVAEIVAKRDCSGHSPLVQHEPVRDSTAPVANAQTQPLYCWTLLSCRILVLMAFDRITVDPERMHGLPCIRDLRLTVGTVLGQLAAGRSVDELLANYPYLESEDVSAALEYAAAMVNEREVALTRPA